MSTSVDIVSPASGYWGALGNVNTLAACGYWVVGSISVISGPLVVAATARIYDGNVPGTFHEEPIFDNTPAVPPVSPWGSGWTGWYDWSGGFEKNTGVMEYRIHCRLSFKRTVPLPSGTPVLLMIQPNTALTATTCPVGVGKQGDWKLPRTDEQVVLSSVRPPWPLDQLSGRSARATRTERFQQVCYELHGGLDAQSQAGRQLESLVVSPAMLEGRTAPVPDIGLK